MPRALAVSPDGATLYVTGAARGCAVRDRPRDVARSARSRSAASRSACSWIPTAPRCSSRARRTTRSSRVDAASLTVDRARRRRARAVGARLVAATARCSSRTSCHRGSPRSIPRRSRSARSWTLPDIAPRGDDARLRARRGRAASTIVAPRPGTDELWIAAPPARHRHAAARSRLRVHRVPVARGRARRWHATAARSRSTSPTSRGIDGSFGDIVSGRTRSRSPPTARTRSSSTRNSEDVLVVDARAEVEAALLRPLPGHMPEGIVIAPDDSVAYIDERNTGDVAVVRLDRSGSSLALSVDGVIPRLATDPMPANLRLGQHLFYSANSDEYPITRNHWVACASCHIEGRSDAVTWLFEQGPRDTPIERGRHARHRLPVSHRRSQPRAGLLADREHRAGRPVRSGRAGRRSSIALAAYVNLGIPAPDPADHRPDARRRAVARCSSDPAVGCAGCHAGPRFTDSGAGNPTLDLAGTVRLHDVGTCATDDALPGCRAHRPRRTPARARASSTRRRSPASHRRRRTSTTAAPPRCSTCSS